MDVRTLTVDSQSNTGLLKQAFEPLNSSRSIALAIVVGALVGVIPKFSLLPWLFGVVAMLMPVNLVALIATIAIVSYGGQILDPWFHQIGLELLRAPWLQEFWQTVAASDWFVWFQMHNTVVVGGLATWLVGVVPGYFICRGLVVLFRPLVIHIFGLDGEAHSRSPVVGA